MHYWPYRYLTHYAGIFRPSNKKTLFFIFSSIQESCCKKFSSHWQWFAWAKQTEVLVTSSIISKHQWWCNMVEYVILKLHVNATGCKLWEWRQWICDDVSHDDTSGYRSGVGTPVWNHHLIHFRMTQTSVNKGSRIAVKKECTYKNIEQIP